MTDILFCKKAPLNCQSQTKKGAIVFSVRVDEETSHCLFFISLTKKWPIVFSYQHESNKKCFCIYSISQKHQEKPKQFARLHNRSFKTIVINTKEKSFRRPCFKYGWQPNINKFNSRMPHSLEKKPGENFSGANLPVQLTRTRYQYETRINALQWHNTQCMTVY